MGEVYRDIGQEPIRLEIRVDGILSGVCQGIIVPARRGRHLAISYGPVMDWRTHHGTWNLDSLIHELKTTAREKNCTFIRLSPFWPREETGMPNQSLPSPLHLLAEHIWYLPLSDPHPWKKFPCPPQTKPKTEEELLMNLRKTTRNLVRRAEREGVEILRSENPEKDIDHFLALHEETRKRHHFTPYTDKFFRAQVLRFSERKECTLYMARYKNEIIASSVHMHMGGETSYHHGASTSKYPKIPASYLLQWTAICDALKRGDHTYSFWGIAPEGARKHPFQGVTTFKRGFGGELLELTHCGDIPLSKRYRYTRAFEQIRKWRRGF
jgi:lipid II:glycine glycyltransferase (peptidoglycan interpeptide bridge formation enzyme)